MSGVQDSRRNLCVYTVKLGDYDSLLEQPVAAQSAADFICFTDDATLESDTWEIRLIEPVLPADLPRSSRHPKICAHEYLPDYELSIYIDASIELCATPERLIEELFDPAASDMVCLQHSNRDSLVDELLTVVKWGLDDPARCVEQVNHYFLSPHYPTGPLIWGGLLIRRHNSATVTEAMERWFLHVLRYSRRDQLSFGYVAKSLDFDYRALPLSNADSGYHVWPCGRSRHRVDRSVRADILPLALSTPYAQVQQAKPDATAEPPPAVPLPDGLGRHRERIAKELLGLRRSLLPPRPRRRRTGGAPARRGSVVFMLDSLDDCSASTTIYARQLRDVADTKAESLGYETSLSDDLSHRGAILILSKQFLKLRPVEHLWKLRRRGNILIGCFLDDPVSPRKVGYLDGLIATSTEQLRCYLEELPEVPSFRVTHGIDTRICYPACQQTTFAAAYFGEPSNGLYLDVLQQLLAIHRTPTESSELGWSSALGNYNCHYLLRPPAPPGVIKPFTKAFVAAACGAVVIAEAGDPTVAEMLGEDYPFAVKDLSITGVREAIAAVEDAFGGPDWTLARGIMASLRREHAPGAIAEELATVLRQYL